VQGQPIPLTPSEFDVLAALVAAKGRTVSRVHLLDAIASDSDASSRVVDVIVSSLRRKLDDPARSPRLIVTVPGVGYRLGAGSE
jgi:two-component system, OmpR family, response regulator